MAAWKKEVETWKGVRLRMARRISKRLARTQERRQGKAACK